MDMKKRQLTKEEQDECSRLKAIFEAKKKPLKITQDRAADALDMNQSSVNHYLNGRNALNPVVAAGFAKLLQVAVEDFSPRLAEDLRQLAEATKPQETPAPINAFAQLAGLVTPKSRAMLAKLTKAAELGQLTEADLLLLEQIAARFAGSSKNES